MGSGFLEGEGGGMRAFHERAAKQTGAAQTVRILAILWAWGVWLWVAVSRQWLWLIASLIPYLLFNQFGHLLDKDE
jgi:hypothetical protein